MVLCNIKEGSDLEEYSRELLASIRNKRQNRTGGYIYIIKCGKFKYYKIGQATALNSRLASLQTANPFELKSVATVKVVDCSAVERLLHSKFAPNRIRGEWFKLSKKELAETIEILHTDEI